jgi:hypothetical protein
MKLKPFEDYIGSDFCINYVGIRADEERVGYISHKPNIRAVFPFREDGIRYEGVQRILEESGLGMPPYGAEPGAAASSAFTSRRSSGFGSSSTIHITSSKLKLTRSQTV